MKKRVFLIVQNEPLLIPKVVRFLCAHQDDFEIAGFTALEAKRIHRTRFQWLIERFRIFSVKEKAIAMIQLGLCKLSFPFMKAISGKNPFSVRDVFDYSEIQETRTSDINDPDYLDKLVSLNIDVVVSVSSPQIFSAELLNLPRLYCLNAHGTLLPRHRGVFGSWWTLYCGDKYAGATIHKMGVKIDTGDIVWQRSFPVVENCSQFALAWMTKRLIAIGVHEILKTMSGTPLRPIHPDWPKSYHRSPTRKQAREFRNRGKKILSFSDLLLTFKEFDFEDKA